jgi:hypothetical protein
MIYLCFIIGVLLIWVYRFTQKITKLKKQIRIITETNDALKYHIFSDKCDPNIRKTSGLISYKIDGKQIIIKK